MNIKVGRYGGYTKVTFDFDNVRFDTDLMNDNERDELAVALIEAVWSMGPNSLDECKDWLLNMANRCGVELERLEEKEAVNEA